MTESLLEGAESAFDANKNWFEELVGEGKKFKSPEDLAKGKAHSDHYISTLEKSRDELREDYLKLKAEYDAGQNLQELYNRLEAKAQSNRDDTNDSNDDEKLRSKQEFDPKVLESLVSSKLQELESSKREQENYAKVREKLLERYGESYRTALKPQAERLGLTDSDVDTMARRNPNLFLKTFDLDIPANTQNFQSPPSSSTRNDNFAPSGKNVRKKSYYEELRKKDPALYLDPKTLVQMDKDVQAIGWAAFNDIS